jgi:hypothetical protein
MTGNIRSRRPQRTIQAGIKTASGKTQIVGSLNQKYGYFHGNNKHHYISMHQNQNINIPFFIV